MHDNCLPSLVTKKIHIKSIIRDVHRQKNTQKKMNSRFKRKSKILTSVNICRPKSSNFKIIRKK